MALVSETGKEFINPDAAYEFIRGCQLTMLNPNASLLESSAATVEMVYAFRALDKHLRRGGDLPTAWWHARDAPTGP